MKCTTHKFGTIVLGLWISLIPASFGFAQVNQAGSVVRNNKVIYPVRAEDSVGGIAAAINRQLETPMAKITEIYAWVAGNIAYDPKQMSIIETPQSIPVLINEVISSRKAICQGYSVLFNELCRRCGISSFVIHGLAKMNGRIQNVSHAWVAASIEGEWLLFDPAWGAGYFLNSEFIPHFTFDYFMINPGLSVKTRMPFDPIWQLLDHPCSLEEFVSGKKTKDRETIYAFADSIAVYISSDEESRLEAECRRVKENRMNSKLMSGYHDFLISNLKSLQTSNEISRKNDIIGRNNMAVSFFNKAVINYNQYSKARHARFNNLEDPDGRVLEMIRIPDSLLVQCELIMNDIRTDDPELKKILGDLSANIAELRKAINLDKEFVKKYCSTEKTSRLLLFQRVINEK